MTFNELALREELLKAIEAMGYETPTPIQEKVIPRILSDQGDLIGLAETGSGKTAAFGLPMLNLINENEKFTQGLILSPTRELCMQIAGEMEKFARYMKGVRLTPVYGGAPFPPQLKALREGSQIIIATPGRLLDLIKKGAAQLDKLRFLVLDEADVMLNMGFKDELDAILEAAPAERQSLLLSATMPAEVARIAREYMKEPAEITAGEKNKGNPNVEHSCYMVHAKDKYKALKRLVDGNPGIYGIIFCRTRVACQQIADKMIKEGYPTDALHGDLSQNQREYVMKKFRDRSLQLLVATDIAARGLDVNDLTHVIHFDLPDEIEVYNHRSGRTGRAGNKGCSYAIINMKEKYRIRKIEKVLGRHIEFKDVPTGRDICESQLMLLIERAVGVRVDEEQIGPYLEAVEEKFAGLSREEIIHRFISLEFNRFLEYYGKEKDLVSPASRDRDRDRDRRDNRKGEFRSEPRESRRDEPGEFIPVSISVGKRDNIIPPDIIGLINRHCKGDKIGIGKINIGPSSSIVYVENSMVGPLLSGLKRSSYKGRRLKVKELDSKPAKKEYKSSKPAGKKDYARKNRGNSH